MYKEATGEEAAISQNDVDLFNHSIPGLDWIEKLLVKYP